MTSNEDFQKKSNNDNLNDIKVEIKNSTEN